jgi:hypothetical protein
VAFNLIFGKNEATVGGVPGKSFVLMHFEEGCGGLELAALVLAAVGLDLAEPMAARSNGAIDGAGILETSVPK